MYRGEEGTGSLGTSGRTLSWCCCGGRAAGRHGGRVSHERVAVLGWGIALVAVQLFMTRQGCCASRGGGAVKRGRGRKGLVSHRDGHAGRVAAQCSLRADRNQTDAHAAPTPTTCPAAECLAIPAEIRYEPVIPADHGLGRHRSTVPHVTVSAPRGQCQGRHALPRPSRRDVVTSSIMLSARRRDAAARAAAGRAAMPPGAGGAGPYCCLLTWTSPSRAAPQVYDTTRPSSPAV